MSSVCAEAGRSEVFVQLKYKIRRTFTHLHLQARGYILGHCDERCISCLTLQLELRIDIVRQCSMTPDV